MGQIIYQQTKGTVVLPLEEYHRLQNIEMEFNELLRDSESVVLETSWTYRRVIKPTKAIREAIEMKNRAEEALAQLRQTKVPIFNMPGTKVINLWTKE